MNQLGILEAPYGTDLVNAVAAFSRQLGWAGRSKVLSDYLGIGAVNHALVLTHEPSLSTRHSSFKAFSWGFLLKKSFIIA